MARVTTLCLWALSVSALFAQTNETPTITFPGSTAPTETPDASFASGSGSLAEIDTLQAPAELAAIHLRER